MSAVNDRRDELISIMLAAAANMPGCLSYIVGKDNADENAIWITEVWNDEASHAASLVLPGVKQVITRGRPLIAGLGARVVTTPVGGHGVP
jgi:quinol monooxygenase YgiN